MQSESGNHLDMVRCHLESNDRLLYASWLVVQLVEYNDVHHLAPKQNRTNTIIVVIKSICDQQTPHNPRLGPIDAPQNSDGSRSMTCKPLLMSKFLHHLEST